MLTSPRFRPPIPSRRHWQRWLLILILLAAWALRLHRLDLQDIWWDEARNIDVATRALTQVATAPELDIHPPLYFYGLHFWAAISGITRFGLRFFSAWFGMLTLALVYQLGRKTGHSRGHMAGMWAMIVAALAPFALSEAQETRMYTMSWALLAAAQLALWSALRPPLRWRRWLPFVLLTAAALLTHYVAAIVVFTWALWLLAWAFFSEERWSRVRWLMGVGLAVALLVLPVLPIAWRQIPGYNNPNLVLPQISDYLGQLARAFTLGDLSPASVWVWGRWLWVALLLGGMAGWLSGRRWQQVQGARLSLLASWLLGSLAVFYLILVSRSAFNARYISFILPALWALSGWALSGWRRWGRLLPAGAALTLALLSLPALRADLYDPTHFREDMSGVVAYLQEHSTPQDVILVDQRYPFGFYWQRWNNDFYGLPPAQPANMAPAQYLFVDLTHEDERRLDARLNRLAGEARRVFYVTWFESDMDPRGAVPALLNAAGSLSDEVNFRGYTVRTWEMHPPTRFVLPSAMMPIGRLFDQGITLVSGDWSGRQQAVPAGQPLIITLRWQLQAPSDRVLKVSLRLQNSEGATLAQDDRLLLNDRHVRSNAWLPGENALNIYQVPAPAEDGDYWLTVVVYDADTLAPLSLADGSGVEAVFGQVRVAP